MTSIFNEIWLQMNIFEMIFDILAAKKKISGSETLNPKIKKSASENIEMPTLLPF